MQGFFSARALRPLGTILALCSLLLAGMAQAQNGTVRLIVEFAPGGGQIAAQLLKSAAPDGNTFFLWHDHTISILPVVVKNPDFDPGKDFVAVLGRAREPGLPDLALPDVRERLEAMGLSMGYTTGAQLAVRERAYTQTWTRIIKTSGLQA